MRISSKLWCAALLVGAACASGGTSSEPRPSRNVLTQEQLAATQSDDLYDAVQKLRPEWLTSRGPTSLTNASPTLPTVYMNGQALGTPEYLRQLQVIDVTQVRYWEPGQASARFGMGHQRGVIEISRQ